jgi:hypothetical protein
LAFNITFVHKDLNQQADSLASATRNFKTPMFPNLKFQIEFRHRPSILDNINHWQVFKDDEEIQRFMKTIEFSNILIDQDDEDEEAKIHIVEIL